MGYFLLYILKFALCLILFYFFFKVLMSRTTFFCLNRFLILAGITVCMILPFIRITIIEEKPIISHFHKIEELFVPRQVEEIIPEINNNIQANTNEQPVIPTHIYNSETEKISFIHILFSIYLAGVLISGMIFVVSYTRMIRLIRNLPHKKHNGYSLILTDEDICPFSWGKHIIIPEKDYYRNPEILLHENMHIRLYHTWDVMFIQFIQIIQWFNPGLWLLKGELQDIHEYQADKETLRTGIDATQYQLLLVEKAVGTRLYSMANGFNHSKLKNRISMMLKEKTNKFAKLRVLLLVPVMSTAVYLFAQQQKTAQDINPVFKEATTYFSSEIYLIREFEDYQKMAPGYSLEKNAKDARSNYLFVNKDNKLLFNFDYIELENLEEAIIRAVNNKRQKLSEKTAKPETQIINIQWDRGTGYKEFTEISNVVYKASQRLKKNIIQNQAETDPNLIYPMVANFCKEHDFLTQRHPKKEPYNEDNPVIHGIEISIHIPDQESVILKNFTGKQLKEALKEAMPQTDGCPVVSLKVAKDTKMGFVNDVKRILRETLINSSNWGFQIKQELINNS